MAVVEPLFRHWGVLDVPSARSLHSTPVVRGAGVALLVGALCGLGIVLAAGAGEFDGIYGGIAIVALLSGALGFFEDTAGISILGRVLGQLLIGAVGAAGLSAYTGTSWPWTVIAAIFVAGYINVANFMDGVNGISGLHGVVVGGVFAFLGVWFGLGWLLFAGLLLAGVFGAFLPWNINSGRMFLGDAGSYLLGGVVSIIAVAAMMTGLPPLAVLGPLSIYLADTASTLTRRIARGEKWYESHRGHAYQRMADAGVDHAKVAAIVAVASALAATFGCLSLIPSWEAACGAGAGIVAIVAGYLLLLTRVESLRQ
ncbi:UDP-phosphate glycosyltransferase [Luethyella okanaganae]|uniref:UDP-phosphate glycosyltransferase n=1 Tax=Luethyella okanaganae TaxID=69372 RepID=A0ABW1V9S7_9MICO